MSDNLPVQQHGTQATVSARAFSDALKKVCAVLKKSKVPVLNEIYVRFANGQCTLVGTDFIAWALVEIPAGGDDFAFVFSRSKDVARACRYFEGNLTLELVMKPDSPRNRPAVVLSSGSRTAEFETYPFDNYPDIPKVDGDVVFNANAATLLERINKVDYAALSSKYCSGYETAKTCVEFSGDLIFSLDGFRAAWDRDSTMVSPQPFLVGAEQMRLLKLFGRSQVDFHLSSTRLCVTDGSTTVIFRLTAGKPYDLYSAVPQTYMEQFSVSPRKFLAELNYLRDVTPKNLIPYVRLQGNTLYAAVDGRKFSTELDTSVQSKDGIMLNLDYITGAVRQFVKEPQITVKISGRNTPVVIEAEGRSDRALVLPIRRKETDAA